MEIPIEIRWQIIGYLKANPNYVKCSLEFSLTESIMRYQHKKYMETDII